MQTLFKSLFNLLTLCFLTGFASTKAVAERVADPQPSEAEAAGWTLFFEDTFDRETLGEDWKVLDGDWKLVDGALLGSGTLISANGIPGKDPPGFLRMEFEAISAVRPIIFFPNKPKPKVSLGDLSSFLNVQPPESGKSPLTSGYFFQFGGMLNTAHRITRTGSEIAGDRDIKKTIDQDSIHHVIVENDQGKLRMTVDGVKLLEVPEKISIMGTGFDRVGFYFYTAYKVNWVKVYVKRLPDGLDMD